jgi:CheY-like chemotaxis protein
MSHAHILVVEDSPTNLALASQLLISHGYGVSHAMDAEEALEAIRQKMPDLILMDIRLPGMDGLALTQKLKGDPLTKHIWIVALTAMAMKGDEQKTLDAGCDGYVSKPIDTRALPHYLASFLRRQILEIPDR